MFSNICTTNKSIIGFLLPQPRDGNIRLLARIYDFLHCISIEGINQKQYYGMVGLCAFSPNAPGMKSYSWSIHRQNRVRYCGHLYIIPMCSWSVLRASVCRQPSAYCLYNLAVDTTKIFILSYNFAPGILSNALSKSTKKQCNGWPICQLYSFSTCR